MDKQSITVKLNKDPNFNETKPKNIDSFQKEDEESPYTIVEWDRNDSVHSHKNKKKRKSRRKWPSSNSSFKGLAITLISALIVGGIFGFGMLKLFTGMEGTNNLPPVSVPSASNNGEKEVQDNNVNSSSLTLSGISMYVIQLGIFSTAEKAEEQRDIYQTKGVQSIVWPRENQYFLFAGLGSDKDDLKTFASSISEREIEIYVKEWEIPAMEKEIDTADQNFIESSIQKIKEGITAQSNGSQANWTQSLSDLHGEGVDMEKYPFMQILQNSSKDMGGGDGEFETKQRIQINLLAALKEYEKWGSN
ncbi:hypothetical protein RZN22_09845 [Bacillaceae bacterium S4-13-58]